MTAHEITAEEWAAIVAHVLKEHPEFAAVTVQAMQAGIMAAVDRRAERLVRTSLALVEALNTKPHHVKRDHARIIDGIKASTYHPTAWSQAAIIKEQA